MNKDNNQTLSELTVEDEMSKNPQKDLRLLLEDTDVALSDSSTPDKRDSSSPSLSEENCYESFDDCEPTHSDSIYATTSGSSRLRPADSPTRHVRQPHFSSGLSNMNQGSNCDPEPLQVFNTTQLRSPTEAHQHNGDIEELLRRIVKEISNVISGLDSPIIPKQLEEVVYQRAEKTLEPIIKYSPSPTMLIKSLGWCAEASGQATLEECTAQVEAGIPDMAKVLELEDIIRQKCSSLTSVSDHVGFWKKFFSQCEEGSVMEKEPFSITVKSITAVNGCRYLVAVDVDEKELVPLVELQGGHFSEEVGDGFCRAWSLGEATAQTFQKETSKLAPGDGVAVVVGEDASDSSLFISDSNLKKCLPSSSEKTTTLPPLGTLKLTKKSIQYRGTFESPKFTPLVILELLASLYDSSPEDIEIKLNQFITNLLNAERSVIFRCHMIIEEQSITRKFDTLLKITDNLARLIEKPSMLLDEMFPEILVVMRAIENTIAIWVQMKKICEREEFKNLTDPLLLVEQENIVQEIDAWVDKNIIY
ncbi:hypothetical protein LAZ67_3001269 [Cordylochernes scorpioides]|uniref:Uncharacterized protein n=1 Tax=Cordylochernes scorpioides TaxID=51811 RepID=A0ABY6K8E5_9ARAC|nr:hypothetical protein LAZ67_3001269 [Cordylochernes scorpioides]